MPFTLNLSQIHLLDTVALDLVEEGHVEGGWVLRGIIDSGDLGNPPYDQKKEDPYFEEYTYGRKAARFDPQAITAVSNYLDVDTDVNTQDLHEALGNLVDLAEEARMDAEEAANDPELHDWWY